MSGSAAQIRAGGAYVEIGIRDETRQALSAVQSAIRSALRDSAASANSQLAPLGKNMGGVSDGARKAQMILGQLAYAVEDGASQFGTMGFAGALRASSNNLTLVASQLGGVRAQIGLTAAVVAMQLLPALVKWSGAQFDVSKAMDATKRVIDRGAIPRAAQLEREGINQRVAALRTPEDVGQRMAEVHGQARRIEFVDKKSIDQELEALRTLRAEVEKQTKTRNANVKAAGQEWWQPIISDEAFAGIGTAAMELMGQQNPNDILKEIDARIGDARNRELQIAEQLVTLSQERARLEMQMVFARNQQQAEVRKGLWGGFDELADDDEGERRKIEREHRDTLRNIGLSGIAETTGTRQAEGLAERLRDLQLRQLKLRDAVSTTLHPGALQEGSAEALRQAETNRRNSYDPQVMELREIKEEARELRTMLEEVLGKIESGN